MRSGLPLLRLQLQRLSSMRSVSAMRSFATTRAVPLLRGNRRVWMGVAAGVVLVTSHRLDRGAAEKKKENAVEISSSELSEEEEGGLDKDNYFRFMRFGMVDMSILLISLVAGVSLDGVIARFIGVQGYGAIIGAGLGNCAADVIAGLPEGVSAALGVGSGTLLPLLPIAIPMLMRLPLSRGVSLAFGTSALGFCMAAFYWGYVASHHEGETDRLVDSVERHIRAGKIDVAIAVLQKHEKKD